MNLKRRLGNLLEKLSDYKRFVMAIATMDVPRLKQLIRVALARNVSISRLIRLLQDAVEGTYSARGYMDDDIDLGVLVYRLGGPKLVYAMGHGAGLPSLTAIKKRSKCVSLRPSTGAIRAEDIDYNLRAHLGPPGSTSPSHKRKGHSLLIDEASLDEHARYFRWNNRIGGICREHEHTVDTTISSIDSIRNVAAHLDNGTCHIGRECSVLSLAAFSEEDYHAMALVMSATCKTEKWPEQAKWIELALQRCELYEESRGAVWSVATDGDPTRRTALHSLLMTETLSVGPLYDTLSKLPGLNLQTGPRDRTSDSDLKHLFKRTVISPLVSSTVF